MFDTQISGLLSGTLFRKIMNNDQLTQYEFNCLTEILINFNIPYDTSFAAGNRKNPPSLQLTVHLNPTTTMVFVVTLGPGSSVFSPSP